MGDIDLGGSVVAAYAGRDRSCAILEGGEVRCWGQNEFFAAGYEGGLTIGDDEHPAELPTLQLGEPVVELALGAEHTCARTETGEVRCWGVIDMLGTSEASVSGRSAAASVPVALGGAAIAIAAGTSHTCAILDDGSLRCWGEAPEVGYASLEFVGDNETPASMGPVVVGEPVRAVAAGSWHTCVLTEGSNVRCWGAGGGFGVLGQPSFSGSLGDDEPPSAGAPLLF